MVGVYMLAVGLSIWNTHMACYWYSLLGSACHVRCTHVCVYTHMTESPSFIGQHESSNWDLRVGVHCHQSSHRGATLTPDLLVSVCNTCTPCITLTYSITSPVIIPVEFSVTTAGPPPPPRILLSKHTQSYTLLQASGQRLMHVSFLTRNCFHYTESKYVVY